MGLPTPNPLGNPGRTRLRLGVATLALGLLAACGGGGGGGGTSTPVDAPVATSLTPSTATPRYGEPFHLTPVYANGTGAIAYPGGTVACPASGQGSADLTANWSGARQYTLTVTNSANATATAATTVTPQAVSVGAISPGTPLILASGTTTFATTVSGGYQGTVTWSVAVGTNANAGTIDASTGAYTAPATTGTVVVTATSVDDPTQSASTTATIGASGSASLAASSGNPLYGATNVAIIPSYTNAVSVLVGTTQGGSDLAVNPPSGQAIAVQADGFTTAWTYWLRVTDAANGQYDASVTITPQTVALAAITPAAPSVTVGGSATFSTGVTGGFKGTVTWSAIANSNPGAGTINAHTGAWTAPATAGTVFIKAVSDDDASKWLATTVTVVDTPTAGMTASTLTPLRGATDATITPTFSGGTATVGTSAGASDISANATTGNAITVQPSGFTTAQTYYLRVTNPAGDHQDATVTLTPQTVALGAISPDTPTIAASGSQTFTGATVTGGFLGTVTWSVAAGTNTGAGSINATSGAYTAPATAGTVVITATSVDDTSKSVSTTATVVVGPLITSFKILQDTFTSGSTNASALAVFSGGTGLITGGGIAGGGIAITSGAPVSITPAPAATTTYTLTVHNGTPGISDVTQTAKALVGSLSILAGVPSGLGNVDGVTIAALGTNKARFWMPNGLVDDGSGGFYVSDYENNCIRRIDSAGNVTTPYGSLTGQHGSADGNGNNARFFGPAGLARNGSMLYVVDAWNQTIRAINLGTNSVATLAGSPNIDGISKGTAGCFDGVSSGITSAGSSQFHFISDGSGGTPSLVPPGLVVDATLNVLYVADQVNNCIRTVETATGTVTGATGVSEFGTPQTAGAVDGTGSATYHYPTGLLLDSGSGILYVADYGNNSVRAINLNTTVVSTLAFTGFFSGPVGLALNGTTLYVSSYGTSVISTVPTSGGPVTALAGTSSVTGSTDADGTSARFNSPSALFFNAGTLYVADSGNNTLRTVAAGSPYTVSTYAGIAGNPDYSDSGTGLFNGPTGVAYDNGIVYVADTSNRSVRAITLGGAVTTPIQNGGAGWSHGNFVPTAVAVDARTHTVYVADDNTKAIYTFVGTTANTGLTPVTITGATFQKISGLAIDSVGTLYVADSDGAAVYKVTSGVAAPLGSGYSYPVGVALSPNDNLLYVADGSDHLIYAQPTGAGLRSVLAGTGAVGFVDGAANVAQFAAVGGLATDVDGNLYVADTNNNAVRKVTPAGYVTTICGVNGTMANVATSGGPFALPASLAHPQAVAVVPTLDSGSNQLFIALSDGILSIGF